MLGLVLATSVGMDYTTARDELDNASFLSMCDDYAEHYADCFREAVRGLDPESDAYNAALHAFAAALPGDVAFFILDSMSTWDRELATFDADSDDQTLIVAWYFAATA